MTTPENMDDSKTQLNMYTETHREWQCAQGLHRDKPDRVPVMEGDNRHGSHL